ncbi:MAG: NADH-quinone oxidoreductase subunit K [Acidobacteria bacterium]|nr:NADH-quinone oxidoreductase subunit K [Acidobacteriota bacterium]MCK6683687.1 sodium:proton antiporter [Thermoanaerobaculia bacterium]
MSLLLALLTGILAGTGTWLILRRRLIHVVLGLGLLGHAANLLVFSAGGVHEAPAFAPGGKALTGAADPLPQALVLTAIVIGFGATAFLLALAWRSWKEIGDDDLAVWRRSEPPLEEPTEEKKS